jgi:tetratricopeptide (TPR) repeat protein
MRPVRRFECPTCQTSGPVASTFTVNGETLCEPCADKRVVELQKSKVKLQVFRGKDPTVCSKCSSDFGNQELPVVAGMHLCETCRQSVLDFHYPTWLKVSAGVLLALLVISLLHGRSYFIAGHSYYKGKKLLDSGNAADAVPYFEKALQVVAKSPEVAGNAGLAYLKSGDPNKAYEVVEGVSFNKDAFYESLKSEFERWDRASTKAEEAAKLFGESRYKEASQRMHEAAVIFPAFPAFTRGAERLDSSVAFYAGDYNTMLTLSEADWAKHPDYGSAAALAGAYACVYASGGDEAMKEKAVAMMAKAKTLASSKEDQSDLDEWEPRFNHRLQTRQIITREQYNSQFRGQTAKQEERP